MILKSSQLVILTLPWRTTSTATFYVLLLTLSAFTIQSQEVTLTSKDQSVFQGRFLKPSIVIHTRIGAMTILTEKIKTISFRSDNHELDQITTSDRNIISGLLHGPLELRTEHNARVQLLPASLAQLENIGPTEKTTQHSSTQFMVLRNGDIVSGLIQTDTFPFTTNGRTEELPVGSVESIRLKNFPEDISILFRDGKQRSGRLDLDAVQFGVIDDNDNTLSISPWEIDTLYCRTGFTPVAVESRFSTSSDAPSPGEQLPPPFDHFVWIPPGRFIMGSESNELGRGSDEGPPTEVTLTKSFWMSPFEVTQQEYLDLMGKNPSTFSADLNQPVEKVNWHEAVAYCRQLTARAQQNGSLPPGQVVRLPTEAEWEYACRAGTTTRFSYGDDPSDSELGRMAWYVENSDAAPHPVGQLEPNPWGLYDMHGNVWEWCYDQWQYAYPGGQTRDFRASEQGWLRVARGGSWLYSAANCRSANRDDYGPNNRCSDIGFRVVVGTPFDR